jgi:hypothetical protein
MNFLIEFWNWVQTNSSGVSIVLSVLGFGVVLLQLKKVHTSAEASRRATERALYVIANTETISDFASLRERLKRLQIAIRGESYEMAHYEAQSLREGFHQLRSRRGFDSETSQIALQAMVTFLRKVQDHLEKKLQDQTYDLPVLRISASLSDHATEISGWIEQKRFTLGEEKDV